MVRLTVNPRLYPLEVVYAAAYALLDRCYIKLDGDPEKRIIVTITPKARQSAARLKQAFLDELINYGVYRIQSLQNAPLRQAILQRALLAHGFDAGPKVPWKTNAQKKRQRKAKS